MPLVSEYVNKQEEADKIVTQYIAYTIGAGLIPIPLVDALTIAGIQLAMIKELSQLYNVDFKEHQTSSAIIVLLGSVTTTVSVFKFFPSLGIMTLAIVRTSAIGALYTYALGKVFTQHFEQGGTLLDFDPLASRQYFKQELKKGKTLVLRTTTKVFSFKNESSIISFNQLQAEAEQQKASLLKLQQDVNELLMRKSIK